MRHFARLNKSFRSDLHWWHVFINSWNGVSFLHSANLTFENHIFTDVSDSWGFGAVFSNSWLQLPWSPEWATINIMAKEMVPIVVGCAVWGPVLLHKSVEFHCDNLGLVAATNKGSSSDKTVIRCLWFFTAVFDIRITATHIAGVANNAADILSRNQSDKFLATFPHMPRSPTPLPPALLCLVSPLKLDWTSRQLKRLFRKTYHQVQKIVRC